MNIFWREMKANRKALIWWCIGIIGLVGSGMVKYAGMTATGQSMNDLVKDMPASLQAIFGFSGLDISSVTGYYAMLFFYLLIMAAIHAVMLGAGLVAKEERDQTAEFLFVKPISRQAVLTSKLGAALVLVVIIQAVMLGSALIFVPMYANGESVVNSILLLHGGMFIVQLLFLTLGMAMAAASTHPKRAVSWATGVVLITYLLSIVIDMSGHLDFLTYVTPFKYFDAKHLIQDGSYSWVYILLSAVIISVSSIVMYRTYPKRDLTI